MSTLRDAFEVKEYRTENRAVTLPSSENALVDFFFKSGAARNMPGYELDAMFTAAVKEDPRLAMQTLAWLRDVRGGAGERRAFRLLLERVAGDYSLRDFARTMIRFTPHFGRYDDLFVVFDTPLEGEAIAVIFEGLQNQEKFQLAAKWMPRKGAIAAKLAHAFSMTPKQWRKFVVNRSNTVEQKMCANKWHNVTYSAVPSVAMSRYRNAFSKHDDDRFARYLDQVEKGREKINASAVFPHDVLKGVINSYYGSNINEAAVNAQWNALPDYLGDHSILPIVDVSGSMTCSVSGSTSALDISVGLGLYCAQRNKGKFRNMFMTFSDRPRMQVIRKSNIVDAARDMCQAEWGMNTNLQASLKLLLHTATQNDVPSHEMPQTLLIISDMEFDSCTGRTTNFEAIQRQYEIHGYRMPNVVFWNVNSRQRNNVPVSIHNSGTALVSGYSPSILKGVLQGEMTPEAVFRNTVDVPRYRIFG